MRKVCWLIMLVAVVGCGQNQAKEKPKKNKSSVTNQPPKKVDIEKEAFHIIMEYPWVSRIGSTYTMFEVLNYQDSYQPGAFEKPTKENKYIAVRVGVGVIIAPKNKSFPVSRLGIQMRDSTGGHYSPALLTKSPKPAFKSIALDEKDNYMQGWLVFEIPRHVNPKDLSLRYRARVGRSEWIRVSLAQIKNKDADKIEKRLKEKLKQLKQRAQ